MYTSTPTEINLRESIRKIVKWIKFLRTKWKLFIIAGTIGGIIGYINALYQRADYTATLSFALEEHNASNFGGAMGLASQFGIDLGSNSGGVFSEANIIELLRSRYLIEKSLLDSIPFNERSITLANLYIDYTGLRQKWSKKDLLIKNIQFNTNSDRTNFTLQQDSVLGDIYKRLLKENIIINLKDKKTSIININIKSENELFAKNFAECLIKEVSEFYIETKTKRTSQNVSILQYKTDSLRKVLYSAITGIASEADVNFNLNPALNIKRAPSSLKQIDVQSSTVLLTELVKNLELAKVSLKKETPLIQVIDRPILPLDISKSNKFIFFVIGFILGLVIAITLLMFQKLKSFFQDN